jgi:hypothetical protein
MFINITDNKSAENKRSSGNLINYLEKENRIYLKETPERWFNHLGQQYEPFEVRTKIDGNIAKLGKNDAKFFLVNISPSQKELVFLKQQYGELAVGELLKKYAEKVMDQYAKNFNRAGVNRSKDLLWFGKLEHNRYYSFTDKEVKDGDKQRGELKQGEQMHIQIIASRKDITNKIKLSPMNSSRGRNAEHSKKMGEFDRVAFKQCGEKLFDQLFDFDRGLKDTMAYANILKNGTLEQRMQLDILSRGQSDSDQDRQTVLDLANEVSKGVFNSSSNMLETVSSTIGKFLDIMLEPVYHGGMSVASAEQDPRRKRKKRKGQGQDQSHGRSM